MIRSLARLMLLATLLAPGLLSAATVPSSGLADLKNEGTSLGAITTLDVVGAGANATRSGTAGTLTIGSRWYDPLEYGAMCDDSTNDAVELQATFAAVPTTGGGVQLPLGSCRSASSITSGLNVPVNAAGSTATTGGSLANDTYYCYRTTATNAIGETMGSVGTANCVLTGATGAAHTITSNWYTIPGATGYKLYGRAMTTAVTLQNADFEACTVEANDPPNWTVTEASNSGCGLGTGEGGTDTGYIQTTATSQLYQAMAITKDLAYVLTARVQVGGSGGTRQAYATVTYGAGDLDEKLCTTNYSTSASYATISCAFISPVTRTVYVNLRMHTVAGTDYARFDNVTFSSGTLALMSTWNGSAWSPAGGTGSDADSFVDTGSITPLGAIPAVSSTGGKSITVIGQGQGLSEIVFTAAGTGLFLTADTVYQRINGKSFSVRSTVANAASGTYNDPSVGLAASWPLGGDGGVRRTCVFQNVEVTPTVADETTAYFTVGMRIKNSWQCVLQDVLVLGRATATAPSSTVGLYLVGSTDAALTNGFIAQNDYAIMSVGDLDILNTGDVNNSEGLSINNSTILYNTVGIYANSDHQEPLLILNGSHLNAETYGMYLVNRREVQIFGNSFYKEGSAGQNFTAIQCNNCDNGQISNNLFTIGPSTGNEIGISLGSSAAIINFAPGTSGLGITGNSWQDDDQGAADGFLAADANATSIRVRDTDVLAGVLILPGTTEAQFLILDSAPAQTSAILAGTDWQVANGSYQFCSNCDPSSVPCDAVPATGAMAKRYNGAWDCD